MKRLTILLLLTLTLYPTSCQFMCPEKQFYSNDTSSCQNCFYACGNCTGPDYTDCTSCTANRGVNGNTTPINKIC